MSIENIKTIFTSEDMIEMKVAMKQIIIDQFRDDMEKLDVYLFDPAEVDSMIDDTYEEILKELKAELKEKLREKMFSGLDKKLDKLMK
jgi:flagellar biosynthesis component FlhA